MYRAKTSVHFSKLKLILMLPFLFLTGCSPFDLYNGPPEWKTYHFDEYGFSCDSPYPIRVKKINKTYPGVGKTVGMRGEDAVPVSWIRQRIADRLSRYKNPDYFTIVATSEKAITEGAVFDQDEVVKSRMDDLETFKKRQWHKNYHCEKKRIKFSGMPAVLISAAWEYHPRGSFCYRNDTKILFVFKAGQYWHFCVSHSDREKYQAWADRAMKSFNIAQPIKAEKKMSR